MYLDNAATTYPKPEAVYERVLHTMREIGGSPGRGGHRRSLAGARLLFQAREAVAELFSISDSSRVIFTQNATGALNLALHGTLVAGDHVITTSMEHNSLLRPLYALREAGVEVTIVSATADGIVPVAEIKRAVRPHTRMIAVSHVSNVCGAIQPLAELAALSRSLGTLFLVDGAQSAGYLPIDVDRMAIDLLAVPGHKGLLGPAGTGFLYVAPHVSLTPILQGGTGTHSAEEGQPLVMPDGFEAGTQNLPGVAGLHAGIDFIKSTGMSVIHDHGQALIGQAAEALAGIPGVTIHGPSDPAARCSVLSFTIAGVDSSWLATELDHGFDIAVRAGLHCAPLAHRTLGTFPAGTVRISPGWSTTSEDIAFFSNAVVQCLATVRK